jgi:hypothetical protein
VAFPHSVSSARDDAFPSAPSTRSFSAPPLVAGNDPRPTYRTELATAIAPDRWRRLSDTHQRMLERLAPAAGADDPASPEARNGPEKPERPWICFAPGTPDDLVEALSAFSRAGQVAREASAPSDAFTAQARQFLSPARWSRTTLTPSNSGLGQGRPVTLTWSIIPDGTTIPGGSNGAGEPTSPSNLKSWLNGIHGAEAVWMAHFQQVFDRWQSLTGVRYVYEPSDDGAAFPSASGSAGVRGDVRIGGHFIDGNSNTLAYNFGPNNGDMILDTGDSFFNITSSNSLRLRNVISHEHGHGLGFAHVCPVNQTKLMEPFATTTFDGPQIDDIYSANRQYGDRLEDTDTDTSSENNDASSRATDLGVLPAGTTIITNLSIDDNNDADFYRLTAPPSASEISIILHPLGASYLEGAQNTDASCSAGTLFDSLAVHNLGFELRNSNGTSILASLNDAPSGSDESLPSFALPGGAGPYFIRVFGDTANNAQLYELRLTFTEPTPPPTLSIANSSIDEGAGTASVGITLSSDSSTSVSVQFITFPITAVPPGDYSSVSGTLVFPPGSTSQSIMVPVIDDTLDEANETFGISLSGAVNGTLGVADATVTIIDNDTPPTLSISGTAAPETDTDLTFMLTLSKASGLPASVQFSTMDGTATANSDYLPRSQTATIPPGSTEFPLAIPLIDDTIGESDETFTVHLTQPLNTTLSNNVAAGKILDDDAPKTLAGSAALTPSTTSEAVTLTWFSVSDRTYTIEFSEDLIQWIPVPGGTRVTGGSFSVPASIESRRFFRVRDDPAP